MDNKIGSIDNDGNMTSGMDDFNTMTAPSSEDEVSSYDITSYDSGLDSKNSNNNDDENEEFDVFGNSKPQKEKKPINKMILIIPLALIALIIIIVLLVNSGNKYTVKTKNMTIKIKESEQIKLEGKEKVLSKLKCTSKDEKIATVDKDCKVTGVSVGTTTIYIGKDGKKDKSVTVKVETNKEELQLKQINITVEKDQTVKLEVVNVLEDDVFSWTSNNETIATVDQFGVVTGVHAGTTTVVCRESDGRTVSTRVTVTSDEVLIENISLASQTIAIGEKVQLKPTISPENALAIYTWKSSKESVVEVDENGVITGMSAGEATITVTSHNGKKTTTKIKVDAKKAASITIEECRGGVTIGTVLTLKANLSPSTATSKVTWTSSDTSIATVSGGKVSGRKVGTVTITAEADGKTATCKLKVSPTSVQSIKASPTSMSLDQGAIKKISITFEPSNSKEYYTVTFKSSNTKVATVDSDGNVKGIGPGSATITASAGGKSVKVSVTVNATAVTSIQLTGCQNTLTYGDSLTLTAKVLPDTAKSKTVSWSTSNSSVATVSGGKVTTKGVGNVTITASTSNGVTATCQITVNAPTISSISASTSKVTLNVDNSSTVTITVNASKSLSTTQINKFYDISWTTTNSDIVSITPNSSNKLKATIKGLKKGNATVHVRVGYTSTTFQVVVS